VVIGWKRSNGLHKILLNVRTGIAKLGV